TDRVDNLSIRATPCGRVQRGRRRLPQYAAKMQLDVSREPFVRHLSKRACELRDFVIRKKPRQIVSRAIRLQTEELAGRIVRQENIRIEIRDEQRIGGMFNQSFGRLGSHEFILSSHELKVFLLQVLGLLVELDKDVHLRGQ